MCFVPIVERRYAGDLIDFGASQHRVTISGFQSTETKSSNFNMHQKVAKKFL